MRNSPNSLWGSVRLRLVTVTVAFLTALGAIQMQTIQAQSSKQPVNINTADLATLETLPGVGAATAQKIIDGRPYHSIADLEKVKGLGKTKADALEDHITFGSTAKSSKTASSSHSKTSSPTGSNGKVNVNTADLATLETLPGVGAATAQKIIDGRPYSNLTDLEHVKGLSKTKVEAMKDQITLGSTTAATSKSKKPKTSSSTTAAQTGNTENETTTAATSTASSSRMSATGRSSGKASPGEKVDINTASAEQLDTLYGIGPTKAQAIIDYRNEHGNFQSIEDIMKVNGIKEGEFDKIKDNITVR
jgi:competence protein ComEA